MTESTQENLLQTAAKQINKPIVQGEIDPGKPFIIIPKQNGEYKIEKLQDYAKERRHADETLSDVKSFITYVENFKTGDTQIFASESKKRITAIFDYLPQKSSAPGMREHVCALQLKTDERFDKWVGITAKRISQLDFAEFLDENFRDVVVPDGATLKEIALSLEATITSEFRSTKRLKDDSGKRSWDVDIKLEAGTTQKLEIPEEISINIPIYAGAEAEKLDARLRIRLDDGKAYFYILPNLWTQKTRDGFKKAVETVSKEINLPIYIM